MRLVLRLSLAVVLLLLVWMALPFFSSQEEQVLKQHQELFEYAGKRYWSEAAAYLSPEYEDEWGNTSEQAIEGAREAFRGFIVLDLQWQSVEVKVDGTTATITGDVRIEVSGGGLSQPVMNKVNNLREPWTFTWNKTGWKPGDWKLVHVTNPQIKNISSMSF